MRRGLCAGVWAAVCLAVGFSRDGASSENDVWPGFRGRGDSHAAVRELPRTWERGSRAGNWSLRLPGYGQSSPVVWGGRVYVTAVSGEFKERLHVLAVALQTGQVEWQREFPGTQRVPDSDTVSRGAPTPVVDERGLYAAFESGDLWALTHQGELRWHYSFVREHGEIKGPHGYASSPVRVDDLCILQVAHAGPSYILALDANTGEVRWRVDHPSQTGWSTPAVLRRAEGSLVIVSTGGSVRALEAATGRERWHLRGVQGNTTASPTLAGDWLVIGASAEPGGPRRGMPAPGQDVPAGSLVLRLPEQAGPMPRIAWQSPKVSTGYASPLVHGDQAYFVNRVGVVQCVDLATGEMRWQHRLPGEVWASPVAHGPYITCFCKHGQVVTVRAGPQLVLEGESEVSTTDIVYGVAAVEGAWLVRTGRSLYRISAASPMPQENPQRAEAGR